MSAHFAIQTVIEIIFAVLLIIGFINEDKLIAFEHVLARYIRAYIAKKKRERIARTAKNTKNSGRQYNADSVRTASRISGQTQQTRASGYSADSAA